jgi:Fe-S cluster biogenesis protein NfuA
MAVGAGSSVMREPETALGIVEFEQTPNPNALRVHSGRKFTNGPPLEFDRENGAGHPLAAALLAIDGIERIMIARDFVTIVRPGPAVPWDSLRAEVVLALLDAPDADPPEQAVAPPVLLGEVEQHIESVLDRYIRHLLASDGGEAVLVRFDAEDGTAWVRMGGACGGCPSGFNTLKRTIEQTIQRWVPEVKRVNAVGESRASHDDPKARFRHWVEAKWGKQK